MATGVFCNRCGHRNPDEANFCSSCGAPLEHVAPHDPTTTIVLGPGEVGDLIEDVAVSLGDVPDGAGVLVVTRGPNAGSRFVLTEGVASVGRHPDSDLFLDDVTVSRRHAEVRQVGDHHVVRDVGSLNGTYLNRERIEDEQTVSSGDEIQVGKFHLVFLTGPSEA